MFEAFMERGAQLIRRKEHCTAVILLKSAVELAQSCMAAVSKNNNTTINTITSTSTTNNSNNNNTSLHVSPTHSIPHSPPPPSQLKTLTSTSVPLSANNSNNNMGVSGNVHMSSVDLTDSSTINSATPTPTPTPTPASSHSGHVMP